MLYTRPPCSRFSFSGPRREFFGSTYATRLSAGGVADEWVTQMLRQTDAQVFTRYSQIKLQMKREALQKLNRQASEAKSVEEF
jgi:hypothetical protein